MASWHLITGEFPPQTGGVSDYVHSIAVGLARAGDEVHVWCPPATGDVQIPAGVRLHRQLGTMGAADLLAMGRELDRLPSPRRLLLQWVPHGFGYRSMNLGICLWIWGRRRAGDRVEVMVHEPGLPFDARAPKQSVAAAVHRVMAAILLRAADRVWVSTPDWERLWRPLALGRDVVFTWIPIPSAVPVHDDPAAVAAVRGRYARSDDCLVGHFGMYRPVVRELLEPILAALDGTPDRRVFLLLGRGGEEFRAELVKRKPSLADRLHATGPLPPAELSLHLSACDVMVQPYPDGVNGRQSSMAAVLEHARAAVSTCGERTEPMWAESGAVVLTPVGDAEAAAEAVASLARDAQERARMGARARQLYSERFDAERIIAALRSG